jgi:hypothetical protein
MRTEFSPSWPVQIFIAGEYETAMNACGAYCDEVGLCVTVTLTDYVYTNGTEGGVDNRPHQLSPLPRRASAD